MCSLFATKKGLGLKLSLIALNLVSSFRSHNMYMSTSTRLNLRPQTPIHEHLASLAPLSLLFPLDFFVELSLEAAVGLFL